MKKTIFYLLLLTPFCVFSQATKKIDSVALLILDRMSDVIGDLSSCSYNLSTSEDILDSEHGLEKQFAEHEVFMVGPDKMLVQSRGSKYHKGYWYNGKVIAFYSYRENNYAVVNAPPTIIAAIDSLHENYDVDFPAADFFYPTITDDIIEHFNKIVFLGNEVIKDQNCLHIMADNATMNIQIWVSNDALTLPVKFVIIHKNKDQSTQYEATFSNWKINPDLPATIFEFVTPPGAREIAILSKKDR